MFPHTGDIHTVVSGHVEQYANLSVNKRFSGRRENEKTGFVNHLPTLFRGGWQAWRCDLVETHDEIVAFCFYEAPVTDIYFSLKPGYEELYRRMKPLGAPHMRVMRESAEL